MALLSVMHRGLTPELIKRAEEELGETDEIRIQGIKQLKRLIKDEPDFNPCTDDSFLTRFLRARTDIILKTSPIPVSTLEHRDKDQCVVGYMRMGQVDINKVSQMDLLSRIILGTEIILQSEPTQIAGYCLIADMAGFSLSKAKFLASPSFLYKSVSAIQDCYPSRIKAFHFVNEPFYFDVVISIMRTFMSEKLKSRLFFHGSNMESLHKYLNPKFLPEELGGELGPAEVNEKKFLDLVFEYEEYYERINKFGYTGKTLQKLLKENPSSSKKESS